MKSYVVQNSKVLIRHSYKGIETEGTTVPVHKYHAIETYEG